MRSALKQLFELTLFADDEADNLPGQTVELPVFSFRDWHSSVGQHLLLATIK